MSDLLELKEKAKNFSVLIVEDSLTIQKQMKIFLEKLFEKVYIAKDGIEALELYKEFQPNIILTDIQMPRMDGAEFIESLNKLNHKSRIIVFSAYGHSENVTKFLRLGACDFIQKPVNFNQLTATLLKVVSGKKCDEEEFENELLKDLKIIKNSKAPISLINHYKGIPLIHEGFITTLTNDTITIHSQKIQTKAILNEKSTTFETDKVTIHAKLKEYNEIDDELTFENLEKIEHSPRRRKVLRIKPDKEFTASIFHNSDRYNFEVTSISSKAISFEIKEFDGKIKLDEKVSLTIAFDTFYTTSYHDAVAHKERIDIKATVFKIKTLENNLTKIVMIFDLNLSDKKVLEKYIYQREVELIKEFKRITCDT